MKAYKGFNENMTCRDFQYEEGKSYETEKAKCCETGFHACEYPLDCFRYYSPNKAVFHEVEMDGKIDHHDEDTKVSATKIKIGAKLDIAGMVKASIEYIKERVNPEANSDEIHGASSATGYCGASSATGDCGASSATGDCGASSATGYKGASSATGYCGASSATGCCGASSATGYKGASSATGYCGASSATGYKGASETGNSEAIAVAWGYKGRAKGVVGSYIVLAEWKYDGDEMEDTISYANDTEHWHLKKARMIQIDGEKYKADTWYMLKNGKVVEADY